MAIGKTDSLMQTWCGVHDHRRRKENQQV